ncbi:hypothetical protein [uncultured Gammaproteobacteria bacterium]|nr:hypothetical protein [uncultured Gammaproteobacteria bacterium]
MLSLAMIVKKGNNRQVCFYQRRQYGFLYSLLKRLPKKH